MVYISILSWKYLKYLYFLKVHLISTNVLGLGLIVLLLGRLLSTKLRKCIVQDKQSSETGDNGHKRLDAGNSSPFLSFGESLNYHDYLSQGM